MAMTVHRLYNSEAGSRLTPEPFNQKNEETTPKEKTPEEKGVGPGNRQLFLYLRYRQPGEDRGIHEFLD